MTNEEIGKVIRKERKVRKLTQAELGTLSGTSMNTVYRIEKGIGIDLDLLQKILSILELNINVS